jgi:hypothetical protein
VGVALHLRIGAGRSALPVPLARGLAPGLYVVRATDGAHDARTRLAVVR